MTGNEPTRNETSRELTQPHNLTEHIHELTRKAVAGHTLSEQDMDILIEHHDRYIHEDRFPRKSCIINIERMRAELRDHPDRKFTRTLLFNLIFGARIGAEHQGPAAIGPNLPTAHEFATELDASIQTDLENGHIVGPFPANQPPMPDMCINPSGVVTKMNPDGCTLKARRIIHMSYPRHSATITSVNESIPKDYAPSTCTRTQDVLNLILEAGHGALLSIIDIKSAFRHIPIHAADHRFMGFRDSKNNIYYEVTAPFGMRSSPGLYDMLAQALEYIYTKHSFTSFVRYVDDFMFVTPRNAPASHNCMDQLHRLNTDLGVDLSMGKCVKRTTCATYIGFEWDTIQMEVRITDIKRQELTDTLSQWEQKATATLQELQSISHKLLFYTHVVRTGRTFIQSLLYLQRRISKPHHIVRITQQAKCDIRFWRQLLHNWNGVSMLTRAPAAFTIATDASGGVGAGGYSRELHSWFHFPWQKHHTRSFEEPETELSINWKELYAIIICAATYGKHWSGHTVNILCDNTGAVAAIHTRKSGKVDILDLLRLLTAIEFECHFIVTATHIPGVGNTIADAASRNQLERMFTHAPYLNQTAELTPQRILTYEEKLVQQYNMIPQTIRARPIRKRAYESMA
jgi:hypothetical protein